MDPNQLLRLATMKDSPVTVASTSPAKSRSGRPLRSRLGRHVLPGRMRQKKKILQGMTKPLKRWLIKNKTNPYPSKNEKIQLAIGSQMNLTQVSNWFANARRRVKNTVKDSDADWGTRIKMYNNYKSGNADPLSSDSSSSGSNCYTDDSDADSLPEYDGARVTAVPSVAANFEDHCYSATGATVTTLSSTEPSPGSSSSTHSSVPATTSSTIIQVISSPVGITAPHNFQSYQQHRKQLHAEHITLSEYLARSRHKRTRDGSDDDDDAVDVRSSHKRAREDKDGDEVIPNNSSDADARSNRKRAREESDDDVINNNNNVDGDSGKPKKPKKRMWMRYLEQEQHAAVPVQQPVNHVQQFQHQKRHPVVIQQEAAPVVIQQQQTENPTVQQQKRHSVSRTLHRKQHSADQFQALKRHSAKLQDAATSPVQQQAANQIQQHFQQQKRIPARQQVAIHHQQPQANQFQQLKRHPAEKKMVTGWHSVESSSETAERSSSSSSQSPSSSDSSSHRTYPSQGDIASYTPIYHRNTTHQSQSLPNEQPWNKLQAAIVLASLGEITPNNSHEKRLKCWSRPEKSSATNSRTKKVKLNKHT